MRVTWDRLLLWAFVLYGVWAFVAPKGTPVSRPVFGEESADLVKPNRKAGRRGVQASNVETSDVLASAASS